MTTNPTTRHIPEKAIIQKDTYIPYTFIATLYNSQDMQAMQMSINRWIKKMRYIHTMENHPAIKKNEIMPFAATWMDLETAILSEVTWTKTNTI